MSEHHKESPSHYNAWLHCCWWEGTDKASSEADAGTKNHKELEKGINDLGYEPETFVARWANEWVHVESLDTCTLQSEKIVVGTIPELKGIKGTTDVYWKDSDGHKHYADLKTFSDGSDDFTVQLMGYAALDIPEGEWDADEIVYLHVLHGGICKVETIKKTLGDCVSTVTTLLEKVRGGKCKRHINKYCQYCKHLKECEMTNNAIQVVNGNGAVDFSKMSLPQKLVVCDTVEKLIKALKKDATEEARRNGGFIEADGIRYEIKTKNGPGRVGDICQVAAAIPMVETKSGETCRLKQLTGAELMDICELPKTAFINAMKEKNEDNKMVLKKTIENWCASFYEKGDPIEYLSRVK